MAFAYAGARGLALAARSERGVDQVGDDVKKANPNTRPLKVITDVTEESSVNNLFNQAFNEFDELDVYSPMAISSKSILGLDHNAGAFQTVLLVESDLDSW